MTGRRRAVLAALLLIAGLGTAPAPAYATPGDDCADQVQPLHRSEAGLRPVPVVFVHGVNTDATGATWPDPDPAHPGRSWLRGAVESIGHTYVRTSIVLDTYAFDYHAHSLDEWVTGKDLGPRLAQGLMCLNRAYHMKVIVVAYSMGGLVTQAAAAASDGSGGQVGDHLAEVITIGTPYQGSTALSLVQGARVAIDDAGRAGLDALLGACATQRRAVLDDPAGSDLDVCDLPSILPSTVGTDLTWQSPALTALAQDSPWPGQLRVHTIAGSIHLNVRLDGAAGGPLGTGLADSGIGDAIMPPDSAQAGAREDQPTIVTCYENVWTIPRSPCNHLNLMSDPTVINDVVSEVTLAAASTLSTNPTPRALPCTDGPQAHRVPGALPGSFYFVRPSTNCEELYVLSDGLLRRATSIVTRSDAFAGNVLAQSFAVAPDGRRVAWTGNLGQSPADPGRGDLLTASIDGTGQKVLRSGYAFDSGAPTWQPDSTRLLVTDTAPRLVNVDSGRVATASGPVATPYAVWSPGGGYLAYADHGDIVVSTADGAVVHRVAFVPAPHSDVAAAVRESGIAVRAVSDDGRYVTITARPSDPTYPRYGAAFVDAATGHEIPVAARQPGGPELAMYPLAGGAVVLAAQGFDPLSATLQVVSPTGAVVATATLPQGYRLLGFTR